MGLFGDDELQDQRLTLLERHIRTLTETVQQNQGDIAACLIMQLALQVQIEQKVSAGEVDPVIGTLNERLGEARVQLVQAAGAATENWASVQKNVSGLMQGLRAEVQEATDRLANA